MILYRTDNMEDAVRSLCAKHRCVMVYFHYRCLRKIRIRLNLLADMPMLLAKPWMPGCPAVIDSWRRNGGLMIYHSRHHIKVLPECDAMLFCEAEFSHRKYLEIIQCCKSEVVVYRPPNWELHNESVHSMYPTTEVHAMVRSITEGFIGREWTPLQKAAVDYANATLRGGEVRYSPETTTVFEASDVMSVLGITERELRRVFMLITLRWSSRRYHPYVPALEPDEDGVRWAYDKLCDEPDVYRGTRLLRANTLSEGVVSKFDIAMKMLVTRGFVRREKCIYLYNLTHSPIDTLAVDAVANARRGDWYNMRAAVDGAPEYQRT